MKKTLTINISGIVFHIDDDAYEMLRTYLGKISARFSDTEEGKEIIVDIEARIAELFSERLKDKKQVVCIADVENIINRMGDPEEFAEDEEEDSSENKKSQKVKDSEYEFGKRLYRDGDNRVIGGVAGGFGAYFGIDPVIIRIIFIILAFLQVGVIGYIIFWIAVPVARTTSQKLEMQGKRVNVSNIEQSISEEFNEVKNNFRKFRGSKNQEKAKEIIDPFIHVIGVIIQGFAKFIVLILGISFLLIGFAFILGLSGTFFMENWVFGPFDTNWVNYPDVMTVIADPENVRLFIISIYFLVGIPILALIYGGLRMIFRFNANNRAIAGFGFIIWFIALIIAFSISFIEARNFKSKAMIRNDIETIQPSSSVIYLISSPDTITDYYSEMEEFLSIDEAKLVYDGNYRLFIRPEFDIEKSNSNEIQLIEKRSSRAATKKDARKNADEIIYSISQSDSIITLSPFFEIAKDSKYRGQKLELVLKLPVGKHVFINDNLSDIIWNSSYTNGIWPGDLLDHEWEMTEDGLKEVK